MREKTQIGRKEVKEREEARETFRFGERRKISMQKKMREDKVVAVPFITKSKELEAQ